MLPDGSLDPGVAAQMKPGGRLDRIATVLDRARARSRIPLVVGPETVETWQQVAQPTVTTRPALARVRAAVARATTELLPATYVPIDEVALEAAGLGDNLPAQ